MRALILCLALAACSGEPAQTPADTNTETAAPAEPANAVPAITPPSSVEEALAQMPSWEEARARGVDFRGVGQEPGWLLDVYQQGRIRFLWDYGENLADFPLPAPAYPQEGATQYQTQADGRSLTVTIRRAPCQDAMSGEAYPSRVEVVIDGRTLSGCGRSV